MIRTYMRVGTLCIVFGGARSTSAASPANDIDFEGSNQDEFASRDVSNSSGTRARIRTSIMGFLAPLQSGF